MLSYTYRHHVTSSWMCWENTMSALSLFSQMNIQNKLKNALQSEAHGNEKKSWLVTTSWLFTLIHSQRNFNFLTSWNTTFHTADRIDRRNIRLVGMHEKWKRWWKMRKSETIHRQPSIMLRAQRLDDNRQWWWKERKKSFEIFLMNHFSSFSNSSIAEKWVEKMFSKMWMILFEQEFSI